jgi:hypothetical protein
MKIRKKNESGETRDQLLREYFLNAYLIALLKQAGNEVRLKRQVARESTREALANG